MATLVDKVEELSLKEDGTTVAATTAAEGETSGKTTEGETHAEGIEGGAPSIGHIKACCGLGRCIVSESEDTPLKHCGQCKQIKYCCREHQVEHFKYGGHKQCCAGRKNAEQEPLVFDKFVQAADTAMKVRDFKTALINYGAMLELTEKNSDIFHPQCANILDQMAKAYKGMQKFEEAINVYQRIILIRDFNSTTTADEAEKTKIYHQSFLTMGSLAEAYMMYGNMDIASEILKKAETGAIDLFGAESFQRGQALMSLGTCYGQMEKPQESLDTFMKAVALDGYNGTSNKNSSEILAVGNTYFNMGIISKGLDQKKEACAYFEKAIELKQSAGLPASHKDIVEIQSYVKGCK